jgi:hypothetical protein
MSHIITLHPVEMSPSVMKDLESRGLIIRLCPRNHELPARPGETLWEPIYDSAESLGPHRLITVSVNSTAFAEFGTHADNEEFLLIGDSAMKPLYLVIALRTGNEIQRKARESTLSGDDFVCLRVRFNDPEVSFFTMRANIPHGEAVGHTNGRPATFYVTEPRDLETDLTDLGEYQLRVAEER